jgi:hypothetical protein
MAAVLVITDRFWPCADDAAAAVLHWAEQRIEDGLKVDVLTPRWHPSWPERAACRRVTVHRLGPPPTSNWSSSLHYKATLRWLQATALRYDSIVIDSVSGLLLFLSGRLEHPRRLAVTRIPRPLGPAHRVNGTGSGQRSPMLEIDSNLAVAWRRLEGLIVPQPAWQRTLVAAGLANERMWQLPWWAARPLPRSPEISRTARATLAAVSPDFHVSPSCQRLAVCFDQFDGGSQLPRLLTAFGSLIDRFPTARLWVFGQGPLLPSFYESVRERCWHHQIQFFSPFDDVTELMQAADLILLPTAGSSQHFFLPTAITNGLPCLATSQALQWLDPIRADDPLAFEQLSAEQLSSTLQAWCVAPTAWSEQRLRQQRELIGNNLARQSTQAWRQCLTLSHSVGT